MLGESVRLVWPLRRITVGSMLLGESLRSIFLRMLINRFFLGLFEAGYVFALVTRRNSSCCRCLPLFSLITAQWYRRSEQPLRVAAWYGTNGLATIFASILAYGLVSLASSHLSQLTIRATSIPTISKHGRPFTLSLVSSPSHPHLSSGFSSTAISRLVDS